MRILGHACCALLLFTSVAQADMSGRFVSRDAGVLLNLKLAHGHVTGELQIEANKTYKLNGELLGASAQGALIANDSVREFFYAEEQGSELVLQILPRDKSGKPDILRARLYELSREVASRSPNIPDLRPSVSAPENSKEKSQQQLPLNRPQR
jgi:hypothetical protein